MASIEVARCIPILKWIAGANVPIDSKHDFENSTLLDLVRAHNLIGRFVARLKITNVPWIPPSLIEPLHHLYEEEKNNVLRNIAAFSELRSQLSHDSRIILIKGVSTYILSNREETMRAGDIDLLSNNAPEVVQVLINMGYAQTRSPFMHELGEYTKNSTEFDIHEYFPVYSYTPEQLEDDLMPQNHEGVWEQSYRFQKTRITFDDFELYKHQGERSDTKHVIVTDPSLLAIVICAHAFMNYTNMWSISHREKAYVRLAEIADLFSLAAHPSFTNQQFRAYMHQFRAYDAVEWAASVAVSVFGQNPLPVAVSIDKDNALSSSRFPRCLWWNFWASLSSEMDELLQPHWYSMDKIINQLNTNYLVAEAERKVTCTTTPFQNARPLKHFITQHSVPISLQLQISKYPKGIRVCLQMNGFASVDIERIRLDFGDIAGEWMYTVSEEKQTSIGPITPISFMHDGKTYELTFEIDLVPLNSLLSTSRPISFLVGVARENLSQGIIDSTLIPLTVEF